MSPQRTSPRSNRDRRGPLRVAATSLVVIAALVGCSGTPEDTRSATAGMPNPLQELTAHTWVLDGADSTPAIRSTQTVTLTFYDDDTLSGDGPCNRYHGPFSIDGTDLTIGPIAQTRMACEQARMDAEHRYSTALEAVTSMDATDRNRLVLNGDGVSLSYDAATD
jgi:heat shock protein HslJ